MVEERGSEQILEELVQLVRQRVADDQVELSAAFASAYYHGMSAGALGAIDLQNLYGAALAHLNLARERAPSEPRVHVYNPTVEQHGWQSTHTVVEVVCDDMPFLVDSVRMAITRRGSASHLLIHPVLRVRRGTDGRIEALVGDADDGIVEAMIHFEVDRQADQCALDELRDAVLSVLADVAAAVGDWRTMRERLRTLLAETEASPPPVDGDELAEACAFLHWADDDHFTFLAYREYRLEGSGDDMALVTVPDTGLGLLRDAGAAQRSESFASLPPRLRALARAPELLVLTKAAARSTVHRPSHMDYIGVKRFDGDGNVVGEHRFLGLFTAAAYNRRPRAIPLLRRKQAQVLERAGYPRTSHAGKALIQILETFPRDLLFQIDEQPLYGIAIGILQLQERERIRVFVHRDRFGRFFSCIVYVPRDRFNTEVREAIQAVLERSLGGSDTEFTVHLSESALARLYYVLRVPADADPDYDVAAIESELAQLTRTWTDDFYQALLEHCGEERGTRLFRRYGEAFRAGYRDTYSAAVAVHDTERMEELDRGSDIVMSLYRPLEAGEHDLRFKLFRLRAPVSLSGAVAMLRHMCRLWARCLMVIVGLVAFEKRGPQRFNPGGWLRWLTPPTPNIDLSQYL